MHPARLIIIVATLGSAAALLFPFLDLPVQGAVNGIDGDAWPAAAALVVPAFMALFGDRAEGFAAPAALLAILVASGAVIFASVKVADAFEAADLGDGTVGPGSWILLAATVAALAGTAVSFTKRLT